MYLVQAMQELQKIKDFTQQQMHMEPQCSAITVSEYSWNHKLCLSKRLQPKLHILRSSLTMSSQNVTITTTYEWQNNIGISLYVCVCLYLRQKLLDWQTG